MKNNLMFLAVLFMFTACQKDQIAESLSHENETSTAETDMSITSRSSNKVTICHLLGNGNFNVITVNQNAVQAHLNHGDYLPDADGDGFTAPGACTGSGNDCNDSNPSVNPGASEICGDGIDNNCNGSVDEGCCNVVPVCIAGLVVEITSPAGVTVPAQVLNGGSTGCGALTFTIDGSSAITFTCDNIGLQSVNLTVTDANGNTDFCSTFIVVQDNNAVCGDDV